MSAVILIEVIAPLEELDEAVADAILGPNVRAWDSSEKTCERVLDWLRSEQ